MSTDIELTELTDIVGDVPIPCDFGAMGDQCSGEPAKWIMHVAPHGCGITQHLGCTQCKDVRVASEGAVVCAVCGHVTFPARHAYTHIEAL